MSSVKRVMAWGMCAAMLAMLSGCGSEAVPIDDPTPKPPTVPTVPTEPTTPTEPTIPTEPTQPTEPAPPTIPTEPTTPPCDAPTTFFADADGDGFGDDASTISACEAPAGFVAIGGDCMDSNADVHPGQLAFFTSHRGDGSFDYDCSGEQELAVAKPDPDYCLCPLNPPGPCGRTEGYEKVVPACGESGAYHVAKPPPVWVCEPDIEYRVQGCR